MGDVKRVNQALSIDELLALLSIFEEDWAIACDSGDAELKFETALMGAVLVTGFGMALRGEEL